MFGFRRNSDKSGNVGHGSPAGTSKGPDEIDDNGFNTPRFFTSKRNYSAPPFICDEPRSRLEVNEVSTYLSPNKMSL